MTPIRDEFDRWLEEESASLKREWDSPELWPRIAESLEQERKRPPSRLRWIAAAVAAAVLIAIVPFAWRTQKPEPQDAALLTERALKDVQNAESAYVRSIDKLTGLATDRIQNPPTALIGSYREKLMLIDSAIADLRAEAERNPYNHFIRRELLSLYREKQQTLEGILYDKTNKGATP